MQWRRRCRRNGYDGPGSDARHGNDDDLPTDDAATHNAAVHATADCAAHHVDIEVLKAQIAADYLRSEQAREYLNRNPALDGLEARVATVAAPGSASYQTLLEFVRGMVARGERVVAGTPDYSDVIVESVELSGGDKHHGRHHGSRLIARASCTPCAGTNQSF